MIARRCSWCRCYPSWWDHFKADKLRARISHTMCDYCEERYFGWLR